MGRVSSSFLPGFLSIVLPDLVNSMCLRPPYLLLLPSAPITQSSPNRPCSLLNQTAKLVKTGEEKWDDKEEMINDIKAYNSFLWKWNIPSQQVGTIDM